MQSLGYAVCSTPPPRPSRTAEIAARGARDVTRLARARAMAHFGKRATMRLGLGRRVVGAPPPVYSSADAPEMISISSVVMRDWRARLYWSVSLSMSSPAFFDAFSIADMRDDCSDVAPSR